MPMVDMPISKLREYKGISKMPKDFDEFWEQQLLKLEEVNLKYTLEEVDFKCSFAKCYNLYFNGINGAKVYAKFLMPRDFDKKMPALIEFHGYQGRSSDWSSYLKYVASGFCVAALDCRGQAGKSQDIGGTEGITVKGHIVRGLQQGKDHLLYKDIYLDTVQLARIIMNMEYVDETRVATIGGSQGGALSLICAALEKRIKSVFSIYPFLCDFERVLDMDLGGEAYDELKRYFKFIDPTHETEGKVYETLSYIDVQNFAHRIEADVTMVTGLMDVICPPSTQFAAYNKIISEKEMVVYPEYGHEAINLGLEDKIYQWAMKI